MSAYGSQALIHALATLCSHQLRHLCFATATSENHLWPSEPKHNTLQPNSALYATGSLSTATTNASFPPASNPSNVSISSPSSSKPYKSAFFAMRPALSLLGSGIQFFCRQYRSRTCCVEVLCLEAVEVSTGSEAF